MALSLTIIVANKRQLTIFVSLSPDLGAGWPLRSLESKKVTIVSKGTRCSGLVGQ